MHTLIAIRSLALSLLLSFLVTGFAAASFAQVGISVSFGPPAIPVYEQPSCPGEGYLWTPGYWAWDEDGDDYYWVPGTWVEAPELGFFWTPGYWAWGGGGFLFHEGYWGPHVGFYGGIDYGYGYTGHGYEGGRWENNRFYYNTYVNRVNTTIIHNTYNTRVENVTVNRVSYNGGNGGINTRPTAQEETYARDRHAGPVAAQNQHVQEARSNQELRASVNHGKPQIAATAKPGDFRGSAVAASEAGAPYNAQERKGNASRPPNGSQPANVSRPDTENRPPNAGTTNPSTHASDLQQHKYTPPNTGNPATDKKYQQQQEKLAAKQTQDHQKMQQQQEKQHQQEAKKNADEAKKQQAEQRHAQQTQQMEQKHTQQQQKMESHQQPHQAPPPHQSEPPKQQKPPKG